MGNICRSPTAEGVFARALADHNMSYDIQVDSAGTHAYHVGDPPDSRAIKAAGRRGIDLSGLRARRIKQEDFDRFDYVLAMDKENLRFLESMCPNEHTHKLKLFLFFADHLVESEVPDPYYGGPGGFERVLDLVEDGSQALLDYLMAEHF